MGLLKRIWYFDLAHRSIIHMFLPNSPFLPCTVLTFIILGMVKSVFWIKWMLQKLHLGSLFLKLLCLTNLFLKLLYLQLQIFIFFLQCLVSFWNRYSMFLLIYPLDFEKHLLSIHYFLSKLLKRVRVADLFTTHFAFESTVRIEGLFPGGTYVINIFTKCVF